MATAVIQIVMVDDEGVETEAALPARYEICPHCRGHGSSSAHLGAFTRDQMDEEGPEFLEDYMSGVYDKPCDECSGTGKVLLVDEERCITDLQKRGLRWVIDQQQMIAEERAIVAAEMRLGGEW